MDDEILLQHLSAIHTRLIQIDERVHKMETDLSLLKVHISRILQPAMRPEIASEVDLAGLQAQIARIESDLKSKK